MINPLIYGLITGLIKPIAGGNSACKVYLFSSANSDSLEIESFTGNLKVMIAAPAETGINPDIIAGRQGDFVASADPVNEPNVVQYEINAVNVTQIVDNTFNGIVYAYAKDDTWYAVDMGEPETRWVWGLSGSSYGEIDKVYLDSEWSIAAEFSTTSTARQVILDGDESTGVYLKLRIDTTGYVQLFIGDGSTYSVQLLGTTTTVNDGEKYIVLARRVGDVYEMYINGLLEYTVTRGNVVTPAVRYIGTRSGTARFFVGNLYSLSIDGITGQSYTTLDFPLEEAYAMPDIATDSNNGIVMTKFNTVAGDYTEEIIIEPTPPSPSANDIEALGVTTLGSGILGV